MLTIESVTKPQEQPFTYTDDKGEVKTRNDVWMIPATEISEMRFTIHQNVEDEP